MIQLWQHSQRQHQTLPAGSEMAELDEHCNTKIQYQANAQRSPALRCSQRHCGINYTSEMAELAEHCNIDKTQARHDGAHPSPEHAKRHSSPILLIRQLVQHVSQGVTLEINSCLGKSSAPGLSNTELSDTKIIRESAPPRRLANPFLEKQSPVLVRD